VLPFEYGVETDELGTEMKQPPDQRKKLCATLQELLPAASSWLLSNVEET
jgi:hypothetical protein